MNFGTSAQLIPILSENDLETGDYRRLKVGESDANTSASKLTAEFDLALCEINRIRKEMSQVGISVVKREADLVNKRVEAYKTRCAKRRTMQTLQKKILLGSIRPTMEDVNHRCVGKSASNACLNDQNPEQIVSDSVSVSVSTSTKSVYASHVDQSTQDCEIEDVEASIVVQAANAASELILDSADGGIEDLEDVNELNAESTFVLKATEEVSLASIHAERMIIIEQAHRMNRMSMLLRLLNYNQKQFLDELIECKKAAVKHRIEGTNAF